MGIEGRFPVNPQCFFHNRKSRNPVRIAGEVINIYATLASVWYLRIMRGLVLIDGRFDLNLG